MMKPFLFVADIDNTLIGDDDGLIRLGERLARHRQQYGTKIVYATGRSLNSYEIIAREKSLLTPDAVLTSVGTEIYFDLETKHPSSEWATALSENWNREEIVKIANSFSTLQIQPESEQNPFKISYYLDISVAETTMIELNDALQTEFEVKFIYSSGQDFDILPKNGDKGLAVQFLQNKWQILPEDTVTCGDSGNDIALFTSSEKGIIVGNAKIELLLWYEENKRNSLYVAKAYYAHGVLEGLEHFEFLE